VNKIENVKTHLVVRNRDVGLRLLVSGKARKRRSESSWRFERERTWPRI